MADKVTYKPPPRFVGVDEARVEFLEAVDREVPAVFQQLAGEPLTLFRASDEILGAGILDGETALEWAARRRNASDAFEASLTAWQRQWNLNPRLRPVLVKVAKPRCGRWTSTYRISAWCRLKALELLGEWMAGNVPPGKVDLICDVSPPDDFRLVLPLRYLDESRAAAAKRLQAAAKEEIAARLEASGSRAAVREVRNPEHFAWAARWQCGGERSEAIANSVSLDGNDRPKTVKAAIRAILDFIELRHATHPRVKGGRRLTQV